MLGYVLANSRRVWYVSDFYVWGTSGWSEMDIVMIENVGTDKSVLFNPISIGDGSQRVQFSDLTDYKGNQLPQTINNPRVFIKPKTENNAYIIGEETSSYFKVGRDSSLDSPVKVDLMVVEMS